MTIKKRLARSNIAMLVIPILTAAALALLGIGAVLVLPAMAGVTGLWLATFAAEGCALVVSLIFTLVNRKKYGYF